MDRAAQLLYLENVRDLEVSMYCLKQKYGKEKGAYQRQLANLQSVSYTKMPNEINKSEHVVGIISTAIFALLLLGLTRWLFQSPLQTIYAGIISAAVRFFTWVCLIIFLIVAIVTVVMICQFVDKQAKYKREYKDAVAYNDREREAGEERAKKIPALKQNWNQREAWYAKEMENLNSLLADFYNMNIIPVQFRNISAICYIYDYMSTSRETLTSALFDQHMENGIQRIEARLDTIILSLQHAIYELHCIREQGDQMIEHNKQMIDSLRRTEDNTLQVAEYARLGACYNKAVAYLSLATYLKD